MPQPIVIQYNSSFFQTTGPKLMGANAAAEGFLQAYLRYSGESSFHAAVASESDATDFRQAVRAFAPNPDTPAQVYPRSQLAAIAAIGCLYREDPILGQLAWQRRWEGETAYSLCGITHTTCSQGVLDAFGQLAIAPLHPWDALICTSQSVRATVNHVLDGWMSYLGDRLGATRRPQIQLPVIPLGVDCDRLADPGRERHRARWRAELGIADDAVVFLFLGRLSYHAKANPFPMYQALEEAARRTPKPLHLILAGWFANDGLDRQFREAAAQFCPSVRLSLVDGRRPDVRTTIWSAADVFTSLSDNIQETFGLTPVEAMAAGLPCVISDWDGYRDTVRHGVDGYRIPTSIAPGETGRIFSRRYFNGSDDYDLYIGQVSHFASVDIPATTSAYLSLIHDTELRMQMGAAAAQRARDVFDWPVIIGRYQELWTELAIRRLAVAKQSPPSIKSPHPLCPDPFTLFGHYATAILTSETMIAAAPVMTLNLVDQLLQSPMLRYLANPNFMTTREETCQILAKLQTRPHAVEEIITLFPAERAKVIHRSLVWMLKVGLLTREYPDVQ